MAARNNRMALRFIIGERNLVHHMTGIVIPAAFFLCWSGRYSPPFDHGGTMPFMRAYAIDWPMCSLT